MLVLLRFTIWIMVVLLIEHGSFGDVLQWTTRNIGWWSMNIWEISTGYCRTTCICFDVFWHILEIWVNFIYASRKARASRWRLHPNKRPPWDEHQKWWFHLCIWHKILHIFFCKIHCFFNGIKNMVDGQLTSDCNYIVKVWSHQFVWFPWFTLNFRFFEDKYMNICWGYMCELFTMFFIGGVSIILCFKCQSFIVHFTSRIILTHPKKTSLVHLKSPHVWKKHIFLPL